MGTDRCTTAARRLAGKERVAMRLGKTGAGLPAIIWKAGIMSSRPATIESPGVIATKASSSMMIPKERLCRLRMSQPRVKRSVGISSCRRCNMTEVGVGSFVSAGDLGINKGLPMRCVP